jgi:hypothetical protein
MAEDHDGTAPEREGVSAGRDLHSRTVKVRVSGSKGVQSGDGGIQINVFGGDPDAGQGIVEGPAGGRSAGSATGHPSKPQDGSGGVRNAIVGSTASVVVQSGTISGDVLIPVTVRRALSEVVARQLPPAAELVGRAGELAVLRDILCSEASPSGTVVVTVVTGMAGVGKTALAVKAAHGAADRDRFPGGVLFLDLRGYDRAPVSSARALDSLLRGLGVPGEEIPPETADRVGLYRSVLASSAGPVLVVLTTRRPPSRSIRCCLVMPGIASWSPPGTCFRGWVRGNWC